MLTCDVQYCEYCSVLFLNTFDFSVQVIYSLYVFYLKHIEENVDIKVVLCNKKLWYWKLLEFWLIWSAATAVPFLTFPGISACFAWLQMKIKTQISVPGYFNGI